MAFTFEDSKGRALLVINDDGQFAFSRFADISTEDKNKIKEIYRTLSDEDANDFNDFLDFKDVEFCS